jgi:mono/diheme cytochrome c family protein
MEVTMKSLKFAMVSLLIVSIAFAFTTIGQQKKPWNVPANNKSMKNPKKSDAASINIGKAEWNKSCKSCHGAKGLGDGPKAKTLKTPSGDFSVDLKSQTDGELFYKTKTGRGDMPKYEGKIPDEDIWHLVNLMRSFQK